MAQTTIELRHVLDMTEIFGFDYPCSDPTWKKELEAQFKRKFYMKEICCETIDLFKHYLQVRLEDIMPYYDELYKTRMMVLDPFVTSSTRETYEASNTAVSTINNTGEGKNFQYPQDANPLTDIPTDAGTTAGTTTSDNTGGTDYLKIIEGFQGDKNIMLRGYRENILNINKMIFEDCRSLFMLV